MLDLTMFLKIFIFTIVQYIPLYIWYKLLQKREIEVDLRLVISYFIFGSWFGMFGELFLFKIIELVFNEYIWEYRIFPIHNGIISSYGPIMWGNMSVYICFHKNYQLIKLGQKLNPFALFVLQSGFLLLLEFLFNFFTFALFNDYFYYCFAPDLGHWTSLTNLPFWWAGYQIIVKASKVLYKEEKLNLTIAIILILIALTYQ